MSIVTTNVGSADRIARIVAGLALIAFALFGPADIAWKWAGWIGVVPLLTAFLKWCPAYTILGIDTCGK
ncbi:YgaP family membrane protein [Stappia sp.]|uniref:YgaP family membrane protein n=1 Tax=Stappia sp. TaxID=1870903 RepID=UPI003D0CC335